MPIQEGTQNVPQQTFVRWNDPKGTELAAINRDGTIYCQGVEYPDSTVQETGSVPVISERLQTLNATTAQSVSLTEISVFYMLSRFTIRGDDGIRTVRNLWQTFQQSQRLTT
jgi:hypothetical protein